MLISQLEEAVRGETLAEEVRAIYEEYPVSPSYWALWERRREGYRKKGPEYQKLRRKVAHDLEKAGLGGSGSFERVGNALSIAFRILAKHGIEQGDTFDAKLYGSDQGNRYISLRYSNRKEPSAPTDLEQSALAFTWHKRESGNFEIIAYLT